MTKLANVRVLPVAVRYGWLVSWEGEGERGSAYFDGSRRQHKLEAMRFAKGKAIELGGGSVRIHGQNGRVLEERTYPRSRDPKRSRG
jgi:uncharacterized protein DUF2188